MNTPDQVYTLLLAALLKARADGLEIISSNFGEEGDSCCAITALTRDFRNGYWMHLVKASLIAKTRELEIEAVLKGFDNEELLDCDLDPFYAIGQKLRAEFIEQKGEA